MKFSRDTRTASELRADAKRALAYSKCDNVSHSEAQAACTTAANLLKKADRLDPLFQNFNSGRKFRIREVA